MFYERSMEFEGFIMTLKFNETLSEAEGSFLMIQSGGSGIAKSLTEAFSRDLIATVTME